MRQLVFHFVSGVADIGHEIDRKMEKAEMHEFILGRKIDCKLRKDEMQIIFWDKM